MGPVAAFRQSRGDLVPFADVGRARWRGEDAARDTLGPGGASLRGGWVVWWMVRRRQAGDGRARNRARARLTGFPGPVLGKMQSEAARLAGEPSAREKKRRRRVLVVTTCWPRPMRAVQRASYGPSPGRPAKRRWRRSAPMGDG